MKPLDLKLEEVFVEELRSFIISLPLDILFPAAAEGAQRPAATTEEVMQTLVRTASAKTSLDGSEALFGKWCALTSQAPARFTSRQVLAWLARSTEQLLEGLECMTSSSTCVTAVLSTWHVGKHVQRSSAIEKCACACRFYEQLLVDPLEVYITVLPRQDGHRSGTPLVRAAAATGLSIMDLEDVHIRLGEFKLHRKFLQPQEAANMVVGHFRDKVLYSDEASCSACMHTFQAIETTPFPDPAT